MKPRPPAAYAQERTLAVELGGVELELVTRPGYPAWEHVSPAMALLAAHAEIAQGERVLVFPGGHGALGAWAATRTRAAQVLVCDTNCIAASMAARTLAANGARGARVQAGLPSAVGGTYDLVLMALPKGRDLARLYYLEAYQALRAGGRLYLAGANDEGIKSAIADAEALYGPARLLGYKGGNRVISLTRGEGRELSALYQAPGLSPGSLATFRAEVCGRAYQVCTRPGVFSWRALDAGTRLLLEVLPVHVTEEALDVGCGYGIIGAVVAAQATRGHATLVDVDTLACDCARATLAANGVPNAAVLLGDGLAAVAGERYTLIVSNPPFHSGFAADLEMAQALVEQAYAALEPRGRLVLVANRFLPYHHWIEARFGAVARLGETGQYWVLSAAKAYQRRPRGKVRADDPSGLSSGRSLEVVWEE